MRVLFFATFNILREFAQKNKKNKQKAHTLGYESSTFALADCYLTGYGVTKNVQKGMQLLSFSLFFFFFRCLIYKHTKKKVKK